MADYFCLLPTPEGLCCNCGDEGILLRGERPIKNAKGLTFCSPECADEFDTRTEREARLRESNCCKGCGFDNWEHADDCPVPEAERVKVRRSYARRCPDDGACHHACSTGCFRVALCEPFSGHNGTGHWSAEEIAAYTPVVHGDPITEGIITT